MIKKEHEKIYNGSRWCEKCNLFHGPIHICEHYSLDLKEKLKKEQEEMIINLQDPEWIKKQIDGGVSLQDTNVCRIMIRTLFYV